MHGFLLNCWIRYNHHYECRFRELFNYRRESLVLHHQCLKCVVRLNAAKFELFDDVGDLLKSMAIHMPLHISV